MVSIHLQQSCIPNIMKISQICKSYCEKNEWQLLHLDTVHIPKTSKSCLIQCKQFVIYCSGHISNIQFYFCG